MFFCMLWIKQIDKFKIWKITMTTANDYIFCYNLALNNTGATSLDTTPLQYN